MPVIKNVLDASALLAVLNNEAGAGKVIPLLAEAAVSTVNLAEVGTKLMDAGMDQNAAQTALEILGLGEIVDFDQSAAWAAARLRLLTKHLGLSFGDRSCLALAVKLKVPAVTADREWARVTFCKINLIR